MTVGGRITACGLELMGWDPNYIKIKYLLLHGFCVFRHLLQSLSGYQSMCGPPF